jgi:hypothetical protein
MRAVVLAGCLSSAAAFAPALLAQGGLRARTSSPALSMQLSPTGNAPVDIFKDMDKDGQDVRTSAFLKEAEVKHGRLAMLAAVGWPASEALHPFLSEASGLPNLLNDAGEAPSVLTGGLENIVNSPGGLFFFLFAVGRTFALETGALRPRSNFINKDPKDQFPHDLGFDPLGFYAKSTPQQRKTMAEKELNNGRLAMIAIALYPFIEVASKKPIVAIANMASE